MSRSRHFAEGTRGGRAYGSNNLETLFPDAALATTLPHDHFNKRKGYDRAKVAEAVRTPARPEEMKDYDPRDLRVSQPAVTRGGVGYYLSDAYHQSGEPFADKENPGNKTPVVYERHDGSESILLSGHHRMVASILEGKPLRARRVQGP